MAEKAALAKAPKRKAEKCEDRGGEDQQWRDEEGTWSRAAKRREEKAERRAEALARKAWARHLAKQEEKDLERILRLKTQKKKETETELQRQREEELAAIQKKVEEEERRKQSRIASKKEYDKMVLVENRNRAVIEARSIEEALAVLTGKEKLPVVKVKATEGNKGDCLLVYTQGEEKPLLVDLRIIV
nr:coiled-coil domain-containing protein 124-like [Coffea arabica]